MVSTIIGMIILSSITVSMVLAISIGTKSLKSASNYPLTLQEKQMIRNAGYSEEEIEVIQIDINNLNKMVNNND